MPDKQPGALLGDRVLRQVRYVPRHISHHGNHSGYDALFRHIGLREARSPALAWIGSHIPKSLAWRIWNLRPQPTNQDGMSAELGAACWASAGSGRLCHFIYGEDTYFFTPLWRKSRNRMLATFHYPSALLSERVSPAAVRALDGVIVVGRNQREFFERLLPLDRVHFSPHHIDTDFFTPPPTPRPAGAPVVRAVFVGHMFRDFEVLASLIERTRGARTRWHFDLVIPLPRQYERFSRFPDTRCHVGLSDRQLLELYQAADVGLMPMTDGTANNGLLEMMATGLPVVSSDVGAIRDYVNTEGVALVPPRDPDAFTEAAWRLAANPELRSRQGRINREHAVSELSLNRCAGRLRGIYESMLS
jgi:glycosyltransferase involved in cell wall biosynthesis